MSNLEAHSQRGEPASSVGPQQREGTEEQKKDINADDTAPEKKPVTVEYYGQDVSGNETDYSEKTEELFQEGLPW